MRESGGKSLETLDSPGTIMQDDPEGEREGE